MSFERELSNRSAAVYADFLIPHLAEDATLLDCGCGPGTQSVGLAELVPKGRVFAIDRDRTAPLRAIEYARRTALEHLTFAIADAHRLPFVDASFDAAFCHSMLETLDAPLEVLAELRRVLAPGGVVAVASVEYSGVIVTGPGRELLELFYATKERAWEFAGLGRPRLGRELRGLLEAAGFDDVRATARYLSYGTPADVRAFGRDRADDCAAPWFSTAAISHGLLTEAKLAEIRSAWLTWSESREAFAAFAWCRALGRKPRA